MSEKYPNVDTSKATEKQHGEVCTLSDSTTQRVLGAIDWRRYVHVGGRPQLCIDFAGDGENRGALCVSVSDGQTYEHLQRMTFETARKHFIDYYRLEYGPGYTDEHAPSLVVKESAHERADAEGGYMAEFEPIEDPIESVRLQGIYYTMNQLEHRTKLSGREAQAFVLFEVGIGKELVGDMMGVEKSTVTEYLTRVQTKKADCKSTLTWVNDIHED